MAAKQIKQEAVTGRDKTSEVTSEVVLVTPEIAAQWLGANVMNRSLSKERVRRYALDMKAGRWKLNGEAIVFNADGELANGQHRLNAVIVADVASPMLVVRNVAPEARRTMDQGRIRTLGDDLNMEGKRGGTYVASAARLIVNYLEGERPFYPRGKTELHDFVDDNEDVFEIAHFCHGGDKLVRPNALIAVLFLGTRAPGLMDDARDFAAAVGSPANLSDGSPILALRQAFGRQKAHGNIVDAEWAFTAVALGWNAWIAGARMDRLVVQPNAENGYNVPPVIGGPARGAGVESVHGYQLAPAVNKELAALRQRAERARRAYEEEEAAL